MIYSDALTLTNQLLTLVPFASTSDTIHETILMIRRYLDLASFDEAVEEINQVTKEFTQKLPSGIHELLSDEQFTFAMFQKRDQFALKETDVEVIKLIGIAYSYFKFLFPFDKFTFTSCQCVGRQGPSISDCHKVYDVFWVENQNFFNVDKNGYQQITIPETGIYNLTLAGAGDENGTGTVIVDVFNFKINDKLKIIIGQCGSSGGHGASAVWLNGRILMVSGGGGQGIQVSKRNTKKIKTFR